MADDNVQTVELTGKRWKGIQLAGAVVLVIGAITCGIGGAGGSTGAVDAATWMFMLGIALFLIGRIGGWWKHG